MIDHVGISCTDFEASRTFYDTVLGVLGYGRVMDVDVAIGYGPEGSPDFWIARWEGGGEQREMHLAFTAPDAATVRGVHEAAVALGAEVLHEPRLWPEYHAGYYAVFVRDPDGNNVEAVCHRGDS